MFKYLIMFVLISPLIGIWLVEGGEFSMSVGIPGEANGATAAFLGFIGLMLAVAFTTSLAFRGRRAHVAPPPRLAADSGHMFMHFSGRLLVVNCLFLFVMLFVFGGIQVWMGTMEKGLFRATLGPFGSLPYLMTKFAVPALFAYSTMLLMQTAREPRHHWMWWANLLLVFLAGSTWGFKTTGAFMLLPGLLLLNWRLPLHRLLIFVALFFGSLILFFFLFDMELMQDVEVIGFLFSRLTIYQGDVSWYVWGLHASGEALPNYWPTLLAVLGDTVLATFVSKVHLAEWMSYHYDWMLTTLSGSSLEAAANGHSVTGTPFAEGVIAGGAWGVAFFATVAGLLVGGFHRAIANAISRRSSTAAALLSTYFCFHVFSWLNGGGITQLFHISVVAYFVATFLLMKIMSAPRRRPKAPPSSLLITENTQ